METKASGGHFLVALLFFVLSATIAILLLTTALLVWLSEVLGTFVLAALFLGGVLALLAWLIYLLSLREALDRLRSEVQTIYEVARMAKEGYDWAVAKIKLALSLLGR